MPGHWTLLSEPEQRVFRTTMSFLDGRLENRETVEWALRLDARQLGKRAAVLELLDSARSKQLKEPFREAWRLIEESWQSLTTNQELSGLFYDIARRIKSGERSGSLAMEIVRVVRPRLEVESFSALDSRSRPRTKKPSRVSDLFSLSLTSSEVIDPAELGLRSVKEAPFLIELAHGLDGAVSLGLSIGRRLGWDGERGLWRLGDLRRAYFVPKAERAEREHEPDEFHRGIAPAVKLLHAVVVRLRDLDPTSATMFMHQWRQTSDPVHVRLWCAAAFDKRVVSPVEVAKFLRGTSHREFWISNDYPEVAELRARRFTELASEDKERVLKRLRRGPPRSLWPKKGVEKDRIADAQLALRLQETKRLVVGGADLPAIDKTWLSGYEQRFDDVRNMSRVDDGFVGTPQARFVAPNPDNRFDFLDGIARLEALEHDLGSETGSWDGGPAKRASDWIRKPGSADLLIADFEKAAPDAKKFPKVWNDFGWTHKPPEAKGEADLETSARRLVQLLLGFPRESTGPAIEGITHWLSVWERSLINIPESKQLWFQLWPVAVATTNAQQPSRDAEPLSASGHGSNKEEPQDLDTLNTSAGRLVGVFLAFCPSLATHKHPFAHGHLRKMRDYLTNADGRAGLIARYRMIESLSWFLKADHDWAAKYLVEPLLAADSKALVLWRAVARHTRFSDVLNIIGDTVIERALDIRLGRKTRQSLAFSVVIESLHSFRESRAPAVGHAKVQQMLRSLDDEVRAYVADAVSRFVRDVSKDYRPEDLFRSAVKPFLEQVWPQERSLATPGVSRAFADIPVACASAFADAVDTIERFLVPFDSWSMIDYGLYGDQQGQKKLLVIDNRSKADALLRLLNATIGTAEGAIFPSDLEEALAQVVKIAPKLAGTPAFRRLATLTRH
jgi:hypothetical protein